MDVVGLAQTLRQALPPGGWGGGQGWGEEGKGAGRWGWEGAGVSAESQVGEDGNGEVGGFLPV